MLRNLAAFSLTGPDTKKFLQGQLTCDINQLRPDHPLKGAHCNREGRVVAIYDILEKGDAVILITERVLLTDAIKALKHYGMFSKITWQDLSETHAVYINEAGILSVSSHTAVTPGSDDEGTYYYQKILKKSAFLIEATVGKFLPQELELEQQGALSFTKGCYLGQEVIARLHYLGKLKRALKLIESEKALVALDELLVDNKPVGEVVVSVAYQNKFYGLALINVSCDAKEFMNSQGIALAFHSSIA